MPQMHGFFDKFGQGKVKGQVTILSGWTSSQAVTFIVDTGSPWTLLLDNDFLHLCKNLGWDENDYPDIFEWIYFQIYSQSGVFEKELEPISCIAGELNSVFRIKEAYLSRLGVNRPIPRDWMGDLILHGTFSEGFFGRLDENGQIMIPAPQTSLLGRDVLNTLQKFLWSYPNSRITLTY